MKRSTRVVLGMIMLAAIQSCTNRNSNDDWITGADKTGHTRDTLVNRNHYRYYGHGWYPIYNGRINPGHYNPSTTSQIRSPFHVPSQIRTGGFGRIGRGSSVHS